MTIDSADLRLKLLKDCVHPVETVIAIDQTVSQAIQSIKDKNITDHILYFYVLDDRSHLLGVVSARDLLLKPLNTSIRSIVNTQVKVMHATQSVHDALMLMQKYHFLAMPVIEDGKFLGVIDIRQYFAEHIDLQSWKQRSEVFQTLGITLDEGHKMSTWRKYCIRVPWMLCNMAGGIACAVIADFYEVVLLKVIVLAMFIPIVLALSESMSMQSMTQCLHEIGHRFKFWRQAMGYIMNESKLFFLVGITCGAIVGALSLCWGDGWGPAITIAITISISMFLTAIIGALIPLVLHAWKLDPKIASGPIVLMCADIITLTIYLSLAFWWLLGLS